MPIIHDLSLVLDMEDVFRCQGTAGGTQIHPQIMSLLTELLASVDELHLLEPAVAYQVHSASELRQQRLHLGDRGKPQGLLLPSLLAKARELALVVCTIGSRLEKKTKESMSQGDLLRAVLLDRGKLRWLRRR